MSPAPTVPGATSGATPRGTPHATSHATSRADASRRPAPHEHEAYFGRYIARVPDGDVLATLAAQGEALRAAVSSADEAALSPYAPGKWSVRRLVGHVTDAERIFGVRALRFARGDATALPGFEENAYADASGADERSVADLLDEHAAVRAATIALFRGLDEAALSRLGTANGKPITPRALAWLCAGHEHHHLEVLRERYLSRG